MSANKGGRWCAAPNCSNNSHVNKELSFFRFPKDNVRAKQWVIACRREDLLKRTCEYLYDNCKICSVHFEDKMFLNFLKNRLKQEAVPTLFDINNPPKPKTSKRKAPTTTSDVKLKMEKVTILEVPPIEILDTTYVAVCSPNAAAEIATQPQTQQTKLILSEQSPHKEQLRFRIKKLQAKNRMLTKKIEKLRNVNKCALENIDVEQFKSLCSKFLSEDLARFIKIQIDLNIKN